MPSKPSIFSVSFAVRFPPPIHVSTTLHHWNLPPPTRPCWPGSPEHSDSDALRNFGSTIIGSVGEIKTKPRLYQLSKAFSPRVIRFLPTFDPPHIKIILASKMLESCRNVFAASRLLRIDGIFIQSLWTSLLYSLPRVFWGIVESQKNWRSKIQFVSRLDP